MRCLLSFPSSSLAGALALVAACAGTTTEPRDLPPPSDWPATPVLTIADIIGEYRLTHIASLAGVPEAPMPAWTWPGRVLVLEGSLTLRQDGRYITAGRSRLTLFGDTTFSSGADTASWELKPGNTIHFFTGRQWPENQARVARGVVVVYAGGFTSGGTVFRYQRP